MGLPGLPTTKFERVLGMPTLSYKKENGVRARQAWGATIVKAVKYKVGQKNRETQQLQKRRRKRKRKRKKKVKMKKPYKQAGTVKNKPS